ncbi:MAG: L-2-amino-thiazoline-4-carboxylic acid hydrolase [Anaerolineaceae bacterium]
MRNKHHFNIFAAGLLAGLGAAVGLSIRRQLDTLRIWETALAQNHGPARAKTLITAVRQQRALLNVITYMPENPVLKNHLTRHILPGLALYRVLLQEHDGNREAALAEVDEAFCAQMTAKANLMSVPLRLWPEPFALFRRSLKKVMNQYPADGWDFIYEENSAERVAFSTTRCFYYDVLTALNAPELTPLFCRMDDVMAEAFPPNIRFIRPHTLGRGDRLCDFEYCRAKDM